MGIKKSINMGYGLIFMVLQGLLVVAAVLGVLYIWSKRQEPFSGVGLYPESEDQGLLAPTYKMKKNPGLSNYSAENAWKLYPSYTVGSYKQITNNKRYWDSPCNGYSTPADMCGGLYEKKNITIPKKLPAPSKNCLRVNYYCTGGDEHSARPEPQSCS